MLRKRRHTTEEFPKTTGPWEISSRWPDSKTDPTPFIAGEDDFYSEAALENPMMPKFLPDSDDLQTSINPFPAEIGAVEGEDPESDTSSGSGQSFSLVSTPAPGNAAWGGDGVTWDGNASLDDCGHMPYASHMRMSEFRQVQASFDWEILSRAIVTTLYPHWPQAQARQQIDLLYYLRHIGQGGSSSVYAAAFEGFGLDDTLAVKILEDCKQKTPTGLPREFQIMQSLKHDHIVAFVGSFAQEDKFGVLMYPLAPYNLAQYLQETSDYHTEHGRPHQPRVKTLLTALGCLSSALLYLHVTQNIKHKDIKPQNILVDRHGSVLLADFGISKQYQSETVTSGPTPFTEEYAAPEVAAQGNRDLSADIFSLGCVFLEMATVILSESLKSLHREVFDGSSGSPHPKQAYHHSLPKVERWICHLKEISCREGRSYFSPSDSERTTGKPFLQEQHLDMILVMMSDSPDKRPSIRDLYQLFKEFAVDCSDCHSRTNASSVQAKEVIEQCGTGNASGAKIITNRLQASELTYNSAHQTVGQSDIGEVFTPYAVSRPSAH
jgi:serine/threonine protein kinase